MLRTFTRTNSTEPATCLFQVLAKQYRSKVEFPLSFNVPAKTSEGVNRFRLKTPFKPHFIENLFLGVLDPTVLEYPQIRTEEEVNTLNEHNERTKKLMLSALNSNSIESPRDSSFSTKFLLNNQLIGKKFKVDPLLGYFESESSFIQESLAPNPSLAVTVAEYENSALQILNYIENETQKNELISKTLAGYCVPCVAHLESCSWVSSDPVSLKTEAVKLPDGSYCISGRKTLVYNPDDANLLMVSAQTSDENIKNESCCYTLFLVDSKSQGISIEPYENIGLNGVRICDVVFNNVIVSNTSIIGKPNEGQVILNKLLSQGKLCNGAQCIGLMRKLVNEAISQSIENDYFNMPLHEYHFIQGKIGSLAHTLYSAESMTYLMTGRADSHIESDVFLESLIVKVYASESLNSVLQEFMQFGGRSLDDKSMKQLFKDYHFYSAFDDVNTYLKVYIGAVGVKYVINQMKKKTVKEYKTKSFFKQWLVAKEIIFSTPEEIHGYVHPTFTDECSMLEYSIIVFNGTVELLIRKYGDSLLQKSRILYLLADMAITLYRIISVIGRASRSLCIGLRNAETDVLIARNVAQNGHQRIVVSKTDILEMSNNDADYEEITGERFLRNGKFPPLHATARAEK